MALIKCPECGKEVSDKAKECPQCAYPLNETLDNVNEKVVVEKHKETKEGCFLQTLNLGCMVVFAIIGLILIILFSVGLTT